MKIAKKQAANQEGDMVIEPDNQQKFVPLVVFKNGYPKFYRTLITIAILVIQAIGHGLRKGNLNEMKQIKFLTTKRQYYKILQTKFDCLNILCFSTKIDF
jgi:hypothetical protein